MYIVYICMYMYIVYMYVYVYSIYVCICIVYMYAYVYSIYMYIVYICMYMYIPSLGSGLDVVRGLACSSDPGERYRRELAPGRVTLGGPVSRVGSRQTKTPARRYAVRWQPPTDYPAEG